MDSSPLLVIFKAQLLKIVSNTKIGIKKSLIREMLNLSMCVDRSTNTKTDRKKEEEKHSMCHVSRHLSFSQSNNRYWSRYANIRVTLFNQKSPVHREVGFLQWYRQTDRQLTTTHDVETKLAQRADPVKMHYKLYQNHCTYLL